MKTVICDRIEENLAVLADEDGNQLRLPLCFFEAPPQEGKVYSLTLEENEEETSARKASIRNRLNNILRKEERN